MPVWPLQSEQKGFLSFRWRCDTRVALLKLVDQFTFQVGGLPRCQSIHTVIALYIVLRWCSPAMLYFSRQRTSCIVSAVEFARYGFERGATEASTPAYSVRDLRAVEEPSTIRIALETATDDMPSLSIGSCAIRSHGQSCETARSSTANDENCCRARNLNTTGHRRVSILLLTAYDSGRGMSE